MKYSFDTKISEHIFEDSLGQLICTDAIIAREGYQEYYEDDILGNGSYKIVKVHRPWEEVKKSAPTFVGKPIIIQHPDKAIDITINNIKEYQVGTVLEVRTGEYEGTKVLLADLIFTDPDAIKKVKNKTLRELSCGYFYEINKDKLEQYDIQGEHLALVHEGRAGIAKIQDNKGVIFDLSKYLQLDSSEKRIAFMAKIDTETLEGMKRYFNHTDDDRYSKEEIEMSIKIVDREINRRNHENMGLDEETKKGLDVAYPKLAPSSRGTYDQFTKWYYEEWWGKVNSGYTEKEAEQYLKNDCYNPYRDTPAGGNARKALEDFLASDKKKKAQDEFLFEETTMHKVKKGDTIYIKGISESGGVDYTVAKIEKDKYDDEVILSNKDGEDIMIGSWNEPINILKNKADDLYIQDDDTLEEPEQRNGEPHILSKEELNEMDFNEYDEPYEDYDEEDEISYEEDQLAWVSVLVRELMEGDIISSIASTSPYKLQWIDERGDATILIVASTETGEEEEWEYTDDDYVDVLISASTGDKISFKQMKGQDSGNTKEISQLEVGDMVQVGEKFFPVTRIDKEDELYTVVSNNKDLYIGAEGSATVKIK